MSAGVKTAITLSPSLRHRIEDARERSGRSLSAEVEAQLRKAMRQQDGDELLLLRIDDGLLSWLRAFVAGPGFFGDLEQTAVYLIRSQLHELMGHDHWFAGTVPHLPEPIRSHVENCPKYRGLLRDEERANGAAPGLTG